MADDAPTPADVRLLTPPEVAALLRCSYDHVMRLAREGHLRPVRIGTTLTRFRADVVERFMREGVRR